MIPILLNLTDMANTSAVIIIIINRARARACVCVCVCVCVQGGYGGGGQLPPLAKYPRAKRVVHNYPVEFCLRMI